MTSRMAVKICDFGLTISTSDPSCKNASWCGTLPYVAEEAANKNGYSPKSDIWVVGVMFYTFFLTFFHFMVKTKTKCWKKSKKVNT